jgi:hypothetical protein
VVASIDCISERLPRDLQLGHNAGVMCGPMWLSNLEFDIASISSKEQTIFVES